MFEGNPTDLCIKDIPTPPDVQLSAYYRQSFAFHTVRDRLPIILTKVIDYLVRDKDIIVLKYGEISREEIKTVIGSLSKLKNELQTNKPIVNIISEGSDVQLWNDFISSVDSPTYYTSPWLYVECYFYRKLKEAFEVTTSLKSFDPFRKQKADALYNSLSAITTLADHLNEVITYTNGSKDDVQKEFMRMFKLNLWGNRCDLSISAGNDNSQCTNPLTMLDSFNEYILVDDCQQIWEHLNSESDSSVVDIILDNAGYELFTDLCVADFILSHNLATKIIFHGKLIPWFVSDVTLYDFEYTIDCLRGSSNEVLSSMAQKWQGYLDNKKFEFKVDTFWTLPYEFNRMQEKDPSLYENLQQAKLIIFKGDLNYRKLLGDLNWISTTPFKTALRDFLPAPLCTLRTLKADLICGLESGKAAELTQSDPDWMISGQFGVIQFASK